MIYKTKDGKIGILDYKNTDFISNHYIRNYIKQLYTYVIGLNNSVEIDDLKIYAVKARKMIDVELNQESLEILLDELGAVSQNIGNEVFECNMGEDCINCSFSNICIRANQEGASVFEFNQENILGFRDKFYQHLPEYEIIDFEDKYWKDLDFGGKNMADSEEITEKKVITSDVISDDKINLKQNNIKTSKKPNQEYSIDYFNNLAKKIKENPNFISDRDLMNHKENDFIPIENIKDVNVKADLIEKAIGLEYADIVSAIEFYNELKNHRLFVNDYYPYRRQCILYKNKLKDDLNDWRTIEELLMSKIYLNTHQLIWIENKIKELKEKLDLNSSDIEIMNDLLTSYKLDRKQFEPYQNTPVPIAERILKDENGVKLLSKEKYDKVQNLFYIKELGVGYIRREEYEKAIGYYLELIDNDFLYYKYHAYKQFARILRNMKDSTEFARIYDELK